VLLWNVLALAVAVIAVAGSLTLSLGLGWQACPLCYYQRSFVMGVAAILFLAQMTEMRGSAAVSVLAMPVAMAGLAVACYHVSRELAGKMECPDGIFRIGSAPQQSLAVQAILVIILLIGGIRRPVLVVGMVVGILLAFACVESAAPVPKPPDADYDHPPIVCRPPRNPG
jgi:hypothetical protein